MQICIILYIYANLYNIIHICLVYNVILTLIKQYKPIIVHKIIKNQILFLSGFCRELGIGIVAYSPLGRGFFTTGPKLVETLSNDDVRKVCVNVYYVMGFRPSRPNYFTCTAHLYLYCTLLVPHTYASYIRH